MTEEEEEVIVVAVAVVVAKGMTKRVKKTSVTCLCWQPPLSKKNYLKLSSQKLIAAQYFI